MAKLFGFSIEGDEKFPPSVVSPVAPNDADGTDYALTTGFFGSYVDIEGVYRTEFDLIKRYREMALHPEVDRAIENIVNEAIVSDTNDSPVQIELSNLNASDGIKDAIRKEFKYILELLDFDKKCHEIYRNWYIDGRIYYHKLIDVKNPEAGIQDLRYIDSMKMRYVRQQKRLKKSGIKSSYLGEQDPMEFEFPEIEEYFVYNPKTSYPVGPPSATSTGSEKGIKIAKDSIVYCWYRVNSDGVALEVAEALKAEKLIFLTGSGSLPMNGKKPAQLSVEEANDWLKKKRGDLSGEIASKLEHGLRACKEGVSRAHILDGLADDALLEELFSSEGVGTMVYADEYTEIRKALKKDVRSIMRLIGSSVAAEELAKRTRTEVAAAIGDYNVFEIDGNMVGCVAVHPLEGKVAEMGCLFVASGHENSGIGRKLMLYAENRAKEMGMKKLLALSTQAFNYLQSKGGFTEGTIEVLPPDRKASYEASGRNSKILQKDL